MRFLILLLLFTVSFAQDFYVPDIDPNDMFEVTCYVYLNYSDLAPELCRTINIESSFRPYVKNPESNAYGFMQILPICARDCGYSYKLVKKYWYVNIHVGYLYLKRCLHKADFVYLDAYDYYYYGLYYKD